MFVSLYARFKLIFTSERSFSGKLNWCMKIIFLSLHRLARYVEVSKYTLGRALVLPGLHWVDWQNTHQYPAFKYIPILLKRAFIPTVAFFQNRFKYSAPLFCKGRTHEVQAKHILVFSQTLIILLLLLCHQNSLSILYIIFWNTCII